MVSEEYPARIKLKDKVVDGKLSVYAKNDSDFEIVLTVGDKKYTERSDKDFFDAFCRLREVLWEEDLTLLCKGARRDVWPSGMQRQMGMGLVAYQISTDRTRPMRVGIFDADESEECVHPEEQYDYTRKLLSSRYSAQG